MYETVDELLNLIDYGISIEINPYVVAVPGSEMSRSTEHPIRVDSYMLDNGKTLDFQCEIVPQNAKIAAIASETMRNVFTYVDNTIKHYSLYEDHDMSFEVLAYFRTILDSWKGLGTNGNMERMLAKLDNVQQRLYARHVLYKNIQTLVCKSRKDNRAADDIRALFNSSKEPNQHKLIWHCIRMIVEFGNTTERISALLIASNA